MAFLRFHVSGGDGWRRYKIKSTAGDHATAGLEPCEDLVVHDLIGPEVRHFDPLTDEQDQITYNDAISTRVEELREEHRSLSRDIAERASAITSIVIGGLLVFADFQANNLFFVTIGIPADQRPFIAAGLTALNVVIAAVGAALLAPEQQGATK